MLAKYVRWIVHGQRGYIEDLRVGPPLKMSFLVTLNSIRHFSAGIGCVFSGEMCL